MKCPYCGDDNDKVIDSRLIDETNSIRRRRECLTCNKRFNTLEFIEQKELLVKKKSGAKEIFNREKIRTGIIKACEKRNVSTDQIDAVLNNIEQKVLNSLNNEITSTKIGECVMEELKKLDEVAYVRYAAVYKEFKDLDSWLKEIQKLMKDGN